MGHSLEETFGFLLCCSIFELSIFELDLVDLSLSTVMEGIFHVDRRLKVVIPKDVWHCLCPISYGRKHENLCAKGAYCMYRVEGRLQVQGSF